MYIENSLINFKSKLWHTFHTLEIEINSYRLREILLNPINSH